ncbi:hypothetical protein Dimus_006470 [Dionaea muscipula]
MEQKAVADDVADDVADTSVKAAVVKFADVAAKIVHTPETLVTMTDKDLDVLVDKIVADVGVMDVAGMDDDVALNELHTPDRGRIPDATDSGSVRSVRVVGEGRTDFNARSSSNKRVHEFLTRPDINITPEETNQITREQLHQFIADQRDSHYVGTLEYADAKFFATFTREEAQLESMTHVSELWENWHRNFHEIPQHVVAYVSRIRPDWGSEWWKVHHVLAVCLVAQSHWVLSHINLDKWTIEIYDSLAYKTPKSPGHRLASFAGMRMLLPNILDEAEYFKHSGRERRIEPFKAIRIPPKKVGKQEDEDSYGIWALHFAERLIVERIINQWFGQCHIPILRWHFACQIFTNSELIEEDFKVVPIITRFF